MNTRKTVHFAILIIVSLVIELVPFNFSAWKSLFYRDSMTFENFTIEGVSESSEVSETPEISGAYNSEYVTTSDTQIIHITDVNQELHNIFLGITSVTGSTETTVIPYTIMLTDEANHYPYSLPERNIVSDIKKSYYTNLYPSGKVKNIDIALSLPAGSILNLHGIRGNEHIPFMFSPGRFIFVLCVLLLFSKAMSAELWKETICQKTKKQFIITAAVILLLIGASWAISHVNPICITSPWPHHKQYNELAEAIAAGHFYLDEEPSEELLNVENPYDTIYLQANNIYYLADYAYYDGKYYVYFGIVPELLLYFPFYMLTGHHLPNYAAVFLFYCGFIAAVFALYREIIRRWFAQTPYFIYLMTCILTVCCGNYLFIIARPDLYDTPIMAANMFTAAGLFFWIKGKNSKSGKIRPVLYFFGSLCMALVAGCRPQMLLFSLLAIPTFLEDIKTICRVITMSAGNARHSHKVSVDHSSQFASDNIRMIDIVMLCIPYIIIAAGIMYYNASRFGSVFNFGATYSLTSNDMTKRSFNLHQTLLGLWHYFFRPPVIESDFPFLKGIQISSASYMGKLNAEYTYGGILISNAFLWILLFINRGKDLLKRKGVCAFTLINIFISVVLSIVDVTGAGILQRYMVDMIFGLWLAAVLLWFTFVESAIDKKTLKPLMILLAIVCLLQAAYGFGVILGNGDLSVNVRTSNPELYYYLSELFRF
ncbi:MAG: hypothetical protein J1E98_05015 [Lachnospiraceae bacterium]|nr:hypothetical protein [Lachnospiraceae bacterium]